MYRDVLRAEFAARTFAAALVGRLSYGVVFLSMVLAVTRATGSYTVAGTFTALFGLTSAFLSPLRARLIDRYGLRRSLIPMASLYALLLMAITVATWRPGTPHLVLWVLAVSAGALTPPLGPIMRSLWSRLVAGDLRQRAFSLDTVAEELLYVFGPLLAGLLAAVANPALGVAVSAALVLIGSVALALSPAAGSSPSAVGPPATTKGRPQAYGPILVAAAMGLCLGGLGLLTVAFADREGHIAAVAWVEATLAVGSAVGGLLYGARVWRSSAEVRLPLLAGAVGVAVAISGFSANLVVLAALVGVAGLFISPALTTAYLVADERAAPGAKVQAGNWVNTGYNLANSLGAALAGLLLGRYSPVVCFAIIAGPAVAVASLSLTSGRRVEQPLSR